MKLLILLISFILLFNLYICYDCNKDCNIPMPSIYAGNNILYACDSEGNTLTGQFCNDENLTNFAVDTFNCYVNVNEIGILKSGKCGCPNYCYEYDGKGTCLNNTCFCQRGWKGLDCSMIDCTSNNCSGNGICKELNGNGICVCNDGYTGNNCSQRLVTNPSNQQFLPFQQYTSWDEYGNNNPLFYTNELSQVFIKMSESDYNILLDPKNKNENTYYPASVQIYNRNVSLLMDEVGIRIKGGISRSFVKKSWKVKLNYVKGTQYYQMKKYLLKTSVFDCLFLREYLSIRLAYSIGMPVQRASFSNVWVNNQNYGAYVSMEDVDDQFLKSRFGSKADTYPFYKCLGTLDYYGDDPNFYKELNVTFLERFHYIYDAQNPSAESIEDGYTPLVQLLKALNQTGSTFETEVKKIFDVNLFLKTAAFEILTAQFDGFTNGNNFFLYKGSNGLFQLLRQDFDLSFGMYQNTLMPNVSQFNIFCNGTLYGPGQKVFLKFLEIPSFRAAYVDIWKAILNQLTDPTNGILALGKILHSKNYNSVYLDIWRQLDFGYPFLYYQENFEHTVKFGESDIEIDGLVSFLQVRYASAKEQIEQYELSLN
eukprot:TRINITY_DN15076_c0_g1_i1.p1 TRINITY_DN15076_c0_g1~~TRINITY_DN15076_c0_g1_i1.p1  ORF type:complete len:595 (-),score=119.95 TRINITY_DN15076_c0_g1_i1:40-1824(-)